MKRQTKAEEALHREMKKIKSRIEDSDAKIKAETNFQNGLITIYAQLESQVSEMETARKNASAKAKSNG